MLLWLLIFHLNLCAINIRDNCYSPFSAGSILHATGNNPSMLSCAAPPMLGIQTILPISLTLNISSDKFIIPSPQSLFFLDDNPGNWIAHMLRESFDIEGLPPKEVSRVITEKLNNGMNLQTSMSVPFLKIAYNNDKSPISTGWGFSSTTSTNGFVHLPGSIFSTIFSSTSGLQQGNTLNFEDLAALFNVVTDFRFGFSRTVKKQFSFLNLNNISMSWGIDILYRMGHAMFKLKTNTGKIIYSKDNILSIRGHSTITTAGTGLHNNYQFSNPFENGIPVNGHGIGISGGTTFYTENNALSVNLLDLGSMIWKTGLKRSDITIRADSLYLYNMFANQENNSIETDVGAFQESNYSSEILSTAFSIKFSHIWKLKNTSDPVLKNLSYYRIIMLGYDQLISKQEDFKRYPVFSLAFENAFFNRSFPCRIGWTFSNKECYSSFIELEQVSKGLTFSVYYKAYSDFFFRGRKGGEVGITSHFFRDL